MLLKDLPEDNELKKLVKNSRCYKCVYEGECRSFDKGDCKKYKRDPPDGGYYG
jgi:hypothetical protein